MPIDPNIPLSVRGPTPINLPDIQLRNLALQREARLNRQMEIEEAQARRQEQAQEKSQLGIEQANQIVANFKRRDDGTFDTGALLQQLAQGGVPLEHQTRIAKSVDDINGVIAGFQQSRTDHRADLANVILTSHGPDEPVTSDSIHLGLAAAKSVGLASDDDEAQISQALQSGADPQRVLEAIRGSSKKYAQKPPSEVKTREIQSVNEQGQPVIRIVPDVPGEYPARTPAQKAEEAGVVPIVRVNPRTGKVETLGEVPKGAHFVNEPAPTQSSGGGGSSVREAVTAMKEGTVPPQLPGRASKDYIAIMAEARRQGFNLAKAAEDWQATARYLSTLNGSQQVRLRQAVSFTRDSLGIVEDLAKKWDAGRFPLLNSAQLAAAKNGALGAEAQKLATNLSAQINDLVSELGTVYKGGNSSTDESLKLAAESLKSNWSKPQMLSAIDMIRKNLTIRQNSIANTGVIGGRAVNPYAPEQPTQPTAQPQVTGKVGKYTYTVK